MCFYYLHLRSGYRIKPLTNNCVLDFFFFYLYFNLFRMHYLFIANNVFIFHYIPTLHKRGTSQHRGPSSPKTAQNNGNKQHKKTKSRAFLPSMKATDSSLHSVHNQWTHRHAGKIKAGLIHCSSSCLVEKKRWFGGLIPILTDCEVFACSPHASRVSFRHFSLLPQSRNMYYRLIGISKVSVGCVILPCNGLYLSKQNSKVTPGFPWPFARWIHLFTFLILYIYILDILWLFLQIYWWSTQALLRCS